MKIDDGLYIENNTKIRWDSNVDDVINICTKNNIIFESKRIGKTVSVSIPIEFANIGKVLANIYFIDELIKEVYITSTIQKIFIIDNFLNTDKQLRSFFGPPKVSKKNLTLWMSARVKIKHYYLNRDNILTEYLVLENLFKNM